MKRYIGYHRRVGRTYFAVQWSSLNLPRIGVYADGPDCTGIGFSYGNGNSDPVVLVDFDLSNTRAGRALWSFYWWVRETADRLRRSRR